MKTFTMILQRTVNHWRVKRRVVQGENRPAAVDRRIEIVCVLIGRIQARRLDGNQAGVR